MNLAEQVVTKYQALAGRKARSWGPRDAEDRTQEGLLALVQASQRYGQDLLTKPGLAATVVNWSLRRLAYTEGPIRIPPDWHRDRRRIYRATSVLSQTLGRAPSIGEVARETGLTPQRIDRLRTGRRVELEPIPFLSTPEVPEGPDLEGLRAAMATLTAREREFIRLRFWQGLTLQAIGKKWNLTKEAVRMIERKILAKLKARLVE